MGWPFFFDLFYCMILGAISVSVPMLIVAVEDFEFLFGIVPDKNHQRQTGVVLKGPL